MACLTMRIRIICITILWIFTVPREWSPSHAYRVTSTCDALKNQYKVLSYPSVSFCGKSRASPFQATEDDQLRTEGVDSSISGALDDGNNGMEVTAGIRASTEDLELCDEVSSSFMKYALSIILGRALPDARDGLKVVHRRILWAMQDLKLSASTSYRKCAKVVGDVLGKYHPHSDKSVYDALCRLSQKFMMRVPLVDGHGNFGSNDDPPAAMRYTECRLTHFSEKLMLQDIASETVDMLPNFDSTELEPTVLPSKVPMLLINGSSGIAVGLATSIPPHNPDEIISAAMLMAKNQGQVDPETLLHVVRGPDFPTGGHISTTMDNIRKIYTTGKGSIMLQAKFSYEERIKPRNSKRESDIVVNTYTRPSQLSFSAGSRVSIIVTELPYNVKLRDVMLSISKGVETGTLRGIADLRDESDRSGIRLVIDLKRHVTTHIEVEEIMTKLRRINGLCTFFKCNFIALDSSGTKPVRLTLYSALKIWLDFRVETIRKRTLHFLKHDKERLNVVRGYVTASNHIDEIVRMIRSCASPAEARKNLMEKRFGGLNSEQANSVMRMTLSQLSGMEKEKFEEEEANLKETIEGYNKLLGDKRNIYELICKELQDIQNHPRKLYSNRRRCTSMTVAGRQKLPVDSVLSSLGHTEKTSSEDVKTSKGGNSEYEDYGDSENEEPEVDESDDTEKDSDDAIPAYTDPSVIVINNLGWMQRVKLDNMFFTSGRARSIYSARVYQEQAAQYSVSSDNADTENTSTPLEEKILLNYGLCRPGDIITLISSEGTCLAFPVSRLRLCSRGYSLWKTLGIDRTERIVNFMITNRLKQTTDLDSGEPERKRLELTNSGDYIVVGFPDGSISLLRGNIFQSTRFNKSGVARVRLWRGEKRYPVFSMLASVDDDILVATSNGKSIRVRMRELVQGMENRSRTQLKVIQLKEGDKVACGALLEGPFEEDTQESEDASEKDSSNQSSNDEATKGDSKQWKERIIEDPPPSGKHVILLSEKGKGKLIPIAELKPRRYGGSGYDIMRLADNKADSLVAAVPVVGDDHVLLVSKDGLLAQKDPFALRPGLRHHKMRNFWSRMRGDDGMSFASRI